MFEAIIVTAIFMGFLVVGVILGISYEKQKGIYDKLWQLHEITNEIHSLLVKKLQ